MEEPLIKQPLKSDTPLPLRPPVGAEVRSGDGPYWHFLHPSTSRRRWMCFSLLCLLSILIIFLTIMLVLSHRLTFWPTPAGRSYHSCNLRLFPSPLRPGNVHMTERVAMDPERHVFHVNLTGDEPGSEMLHLCAESVTVIRARGACYVHPMNPEWKQFCGLFSSTVRQSDVQQFRAAADANLKDSTWFLRPLDSILSLVRNPFVLSFCSGFTPFEMTHQEPGDDYEIDPADMATLTGQTVEGDTPGRNPIDPPQQDNESDSDEFLDKFQSEYEARHRKKRSVPSPSNAKLHCRKVNELFESSPIPSTSDTAPVTVNRDTLILCSK